MIKKVTRFKLAFVKNCYCWVRVGDEHQTKGTEATLLIMILFYCLISSIILLQSSAEMKHLGYLLLLTVLTLVEFASGNRGSLNVEGEVERELTFEIAAGREECFFETAQKGNIIDIEYQVILTFSKIK